MIFRTVIAAALLIAVGCSAASSPHTDSRFEIEFRVNKDDGEAIKGASIRTGETQLGITGEDGKLRSELAGVEGQTLPIIVTCPDGFSGMEKPSTVRLTHTRRVDLNGYQAMRFEGVCTRNVRDIVVVVRAQGGAGVTLNVDGKPAGTTNADGIAHVLVHASRQVKSLSVSLDTSTRPELKPKNPSRTYELGGNDAILIMDQTFVSAPKRVFRAAAPKQQKHIPYRID